MSVRIITDSAADMTDEIRERVIMVPLTIRFGNEEYADGVDITHMEFYEKLIESDVLPTTSQATPYAFSEIFNEVTDSGDTAVVITVSSGLSGTFQSACIAAQDFDGIYVVDSRNVAIGQGIIVEYATRLADSGKDAETISQELETEKEKVRLVAMLDTLEYLKRGGRISKTAAVAGGILAIKPVIGIVDGVVEILGKARGSKQGNNLLVKEIRESGGVDFERPVLLGYSGLSDALLKKYIKDSAFLWEAEADELRCTQVGSAVGTHAGPGAVVVAFFRKESRATE